MAKRSNNHLKDTGMKSDEYLDCIGLFCPAPVSETRKKIDGMKKGQILHWQWILNLPFISWVKV